MSKDISNQELARMMQDQFSVMEKNFASMEGRITNMEGRITNMERQFTELKKDVKKIIDPLKNSVDGLAKRFLDQDHENTANIAAHDRFNANFYEIKKHTKLKSIEAVQPL